MEAFAKALDALRLEGSLTLACAPVLAFKSWRAEARAGRKSEAVRQPPALPAIERIVEAGAETDTKDGFPQTVAASAPSGATERRVASILVVEDESALRQILVRILQREQYQVRGAPNLREARLALISQAFDLVILDLLLPDGSGYQLMQWLKTGEDPGPRVLMLSALNEVDDYVDGYQAGADDYLGKPFEFDELVRRVNWLLL